MKNILSAIVLTAVSLWCSAQKPTTNHPPMGFMTWNYYQEDINEKSMKELTDHMVSTGLKDAGYEYIFLDDGWQGGRDNRNNIIPDPVKFPSGMKALADYVHSKGMKIGIYSDAAELTCAGYTASFGFEEQDAKTFANWGIDYLKYDYCNAPSDWKTAVERYETMAKALNNSGRNIMLSICEWGDREPWLWAGKAGGTLWRTTPDVRDKWQSKQAPKVSTDLHRTGAGILDIVNINGELANYASIGGYNDPDMLVVGLYGKKGPAGELGGKGCTDTEYQSQMSLWCMMGAPLMISLDIANMNAATKKILLNKDIIAIDQDPLGKQGRRIIKNDTWQIFVKPLANGDTAVGILNVSPKTQTAEFNLSDLEVFGKTKAKDVWTGKSINVGNSLKVKVASHETLVYRFSK